MLIVGWNLQQNEHKGLVFYTILVYIIKNDLSSLWNHHLSVSILLIFTLLSRVILMWLTVSFPNIAIEVIEIIGRNIGDAFELEKIRISRNSQEWWHDYQGKHRCRQKYIASKRCNIELWDVTAASIQTHPSLTDDRPQLKRDVSLHCNSRTWVVIVKG